MLCSFGPYLRMAVSMLFIPHLPFILMQNMLQTSNGLSRPMISSRMFLFCIHIDMIDFTLFLFPMHNHIVSWTRYADDPNAYWTGYFTSRPALKRYVRMMSGYYLVALISYFFYYAGLLWPSNGHHNFLITYAVLILKFNLFSGSQATGVL